MGVLTKNIEKEEIFQSWNFTISAYDFEIPNGKRAGTVLWLVELKVIRKKWSDELGSYYRQSQYITISQEQFMEFLESTKID